MRPSADQRSVEHPNALLPCSITYDLGDLMGRVLSILAVILVFSADSAMGLELEWRNGQRDLTVTTAEPCTLFVGSSTTDTLFNFPWRLVWAGTAETTTPLVVLRAPGTDQLPGPSVVSSGSTIDSMAHSTTAVFDIPNAGTRPDAAMYVLRIDPTMHARLTLAPLSLGALGLVSDYARTEVTVNGGSDVPYAPVVCSVRRVVSEVPQSRSAASSTSLSNGQSVQLSGLDLSGVTAVSLLRSSRGNAPEQLVVVGQTDRSLTVELPADLGTEQAVIALARPDGATTAAVLPSSLVPETTEQTYHLACVADSASMPATFAIDPTTGTYGLRYSHDEAADYLFTVESGAWVREQMPTNMPVSWGEKSMCIDKNGIVHMIGRSGLLLTHMWRENSPSATWSSEALENSASIGKIEIQVEPQRTLWRLHISSQWQDTSTCSGRGEIALMCGGVIPSTWRMVGVRSWISTSSSIPMESVASPMSSCQTPLKAMGVSSTPRGPRRQDGGSRIPHAYIGTCWSLRVFRCRTTSSTARSSLALTTIG
jgi:hypothetical protein